VTKPEAEQAFTEIFWKWARERDIPIRPVERPRFSDFCAWVNENRYSFYFDFRSTTGALYEVERWFNTFFNAIITSVR
jgi:hypothetical protein